MSIQISSMLLVLNFIGQLILTPSLKRLSQHQTTYSLNKLFSQTQLIKATKKSESLLTAAIKYQVQMGIQAIEQVKPLVFELAIRKA